MSGAEEVSKNWWVGYRLGKCCKRYVLMMQRFSAWLCRMGFSPMYASFVVWGLQALAIGLALFVMSWIVVFSIILALGISARLSDSSTTNWYRSEFRDGPHGFGLYDDNGIRLDPYDPDDMA